jgi:hypothetical protein
MQEAGETKTMRNVELAISKKIEMPCPWLPAQWLIYLFRMGPAESGPSHPLTWGHKEIRCPKYCSRGWINSRNSVIWSVTYNPGDSPILFHMPPLIIFIRNVTSQCHAESYFLLLYCKRTCSDTVVAEKVRVVVTFYSCIPKVLGYDFGKDTGYTESAFWYFSQPLQSNSRESASIRPRLLPHISFQVRYWSILPPFHSI